MLLDSLGWGWERWQVSGAVLASYAWPPQNRSLMNPASPPASCLACGACCFSLLPTFVRVTGDDWQRLGPEAESAAHFIGNRAFMRMIDGHCAALEIRASASGRAEYFCTLYERRPQVCRDLERGSPACAAERELKLARRNPA